MEWLIVTITAFMASGNIIIKDYCEGQLAGQYQHYRLIEEQRNVEDVIICNSNDYGPLSRKEKTATLFHEFAHVLWFRMDDQLRESWTDLHYETRIFITDYAKTSTEEHFAEMYAHYIMFLMGERLPFTGMTYEAQNRFEFIAGVMELANQSLSLPQ